MGVKGKFFKLHRAGFFGPEKENQAFYKSRSYTQDGKEVPGREIPRAVSRLQAFESSVSGLRDQGRGASASH